MVKWVRKRDQRRKKFSRQKIIDAIYAAFKDVDGKVDEYARERADKIATYIENLDFNIMNVEDIQDYIEKGLMDGKRKDVARQYITYRNERTRLRENTIDRSLKELVSGESDYWTNENSNKNATIVTTQRDYIAGIASTDAARRWIFPTDVVKAHDEGIIHIHDMDYALQNSLTNCCLVNLEDMLQNGTVINNIMIEPQKRLLTATTVATQIITAVSSSQYGGVSVNLHDLAPYVRKSKEYYIEKYKDLDVDDSVKDKLVNAELEKEVRDSVQTFNYQINSMSTTNGQSPFLTVFMYLNGNTEYIEETAMLIEEFLNQRIKGLKNRSGVYVTQAFPKLIYVTDENNITEDSPYWYLTVLSAKCTAKRMVPDYISAKIMKELKGDVYSVMGKCKLQLI